MRELDIRLRYFIASTVEEMLLNVFPHCKSYLYGSCVNGFGRHDCDIDIAFDMLYDIDKYVSMFRTDISLIHFEV